ncbi:hypothetical protein NECAME_18132 [Necator americanus]|uniref:Uncharacterized protein n=1 Tax=Necator americanus TaxID=51031 RepID=W2TEF7_NECAM|nr:hypothetical protein NECAME_18132 [Necator americanus]ETN79382.1 hypothetical protein NECAME_18132 [Necator americanus]
MEDERADHAANHDDQARGRHDDARYGHGGATPAQQPVPDPDRHVFHVDAGQRLRDCETVEKIFFADPVAILDEFAQQPAAQAAAKARHADAAEDQKESEQRGARRCVWRGSSHGG